MTSPAPVPPREPEIELLGRIATRALWLLRRIFWFAGAAAVVYGVWLSFAGGVQHAREPGLAPPVPSAQGAVWVAVGLPLLVWVEVLFGRGLPAVLCASAALWFLPMLLADDHRYGFVLRMFATLVACLSLLVWRTLWRLTRPPTTS